MQKALNKFNTTFHKARLKNGADLFLFQRKGMPIYLRAAFFAGSRFDTVPGTAHFLEHMLIAGTKKFPSKNLIAQHVQRVGGDFGASTNNNILRLNVEVPEEQDLDVGLEIISECLINPLFGDKSMENERGAIFSEIKSKKSNPKEYITEVQRRLTLQGTSAGRSTLGSEEDVRKINKAELLDFKNKFINAGRISYVVAGDVSFDVLKEKLGAVAIPSGERFVVNEKLPIIKEKLVDVEFYKDLNHLQVALSCRTSVESYKEYCALKVLSSIIAEGRGSRLATKLRYENGLVYTVTARLFDSIDWGSLNFYLSCENANLAKVKELIFAEFKDLRNNNITADELENAKLKISKSSIRHLQTSESWADFHEREALFSSSEFHTPEDYIETVESISLDDMQKIIDKYLKEGNFYTAICGDWIE
jgi:predicted Zn-dependent peptidase